MTTLQTRRDFFRKFRIEQQEVTSDFLRPPYAKNEVDFLAACNQCKACMTACPSNAIVFEHGYPVCLPHCDTCLSCVPVCKTGALQHHYIALKVDYRCDNKLSKYCQSCIEGCDQNAMTLMDNGRVVIANEECNRCGKCINNCDFNAISFNIKTS